MKILFASHAFAPSIGGIESCSLDLAHSFLKLGHEVRVITQTPRRNQEDDHLLTVIRKPDIFTLNRLVSWSDVFFQNNVSLQTAWPLLFIRKPWVVCSQTWLKNHLGSVGIWNHLKRLALSRANNVYISKAVRDHVGYCGSIIPNPYDSKLFRVLPEIKRDKSLVFLGRLVSDKGCDLLIQGLALLRDTGLILPLTIIGSGPEEAMLKQQVASHKLESLVCFMGPLTGEALVCELNRHQVLVAPSRWKEPFGIVALEGLACGCLVVGSEGGGLPDAIGPGGKLFKSGDVTSLAFAIRHVLEQSEALLAEPAAITAHLHRHRVEHVAAMYLDVFENALK